MDLNDTTLTLFNEALFKMEQKHPRKKEKIRFIFDCKDTEFAFQNAESVAC